eukprot:767696-Hanusia_phi.AAC.10
MVGKKRHLIGVGYQDFRVMGIKGGYCGQILLRKMCVWWGTLGMNLEGGGWCYETQKGKMNPEGCKGVGVVEVEGRRDLGRGANNESTVCLTRKVVKEGRVGRVGRVGRERTW